MLRLARYDVPSAGCLLGFPPAPVRQVVRDPSCRSGGIQAITIKFSAGIQRECYSVVVRVRWRIPVFLRLLSILVYSSLAFAAAAPTFPALTYSTYLRDSFTPTAIATDAA